MVKSDNNKEKEGVNMTTALFNKSLRFAKYKSIEVGDTISFPNASALIKSGVIVRIKGLNQYHKEIWTSNGGYFIADRNAQNKFDLTKAGN